MPVSIQRCQGYSAEKLTDHTSRARFGPWPDMPQSPRAMSAMSLGRSGASEGTDHDGTGPDLAAGGGLRPFIRCSQSPVGFRFLRGLGPGWGIASRVSVLQAPPGTLDLLAAFDQAVASTGIVSGVGFTGAGLAVPEGSSSVSTGCRAEPCLDLTSGRFHGRSPQLACYPASHRCRELGQGRITRSPFHHQGDGNCQNHSCSLAFHSWPSSDISRPRLSPRERSLPAR